MRPCRTLSTLVALGALTALPACSSSLFGGGGGGGQYSQNNYRAPASYSSTAGTQMAPNNANQEAVPTSPELVRKVQRELKRNGDYHARVDGVWGPMTEHGVRQWQQAHNLNATGAIDVATLQSMNITAPGQNDENANNGTQPYNNNNNGQAYNNNGGTQANPNNGTGSADTSNQANANGANGNNTNYNTAGTHQSGSSYSSTNQPNNNAPYPAGGNTNGANNTTGNNANGGSGTTH